MAAQQDQHELVDIISDSLLGNQLNEKYCGEILEGIHLLSQLID